MKLPIRFKRIGYVGMTPKPDFEDTLDDYVDLGARPVKAANIYRSRKEARKRYQSVSSVYISVVDKEKT